MLHLLPTRIGGAAENMAADFLLLQAYPKPDSPRFRHYGWRIPAITFGYSQIWETVQAQCPPDREFCRRPTGGGIVDHENDWTYSLVIPRSHEFCGHPAPLVYYLIHRILCDVLMEQDQDVIQQQEKDCSCRPRRPGVCFARPEPHDVIHRETGAKVAGAALKRNKNGLLVQGSIARAPLTDFDWARFEQDFHTHLAKSLEREIEEQPWPDFGPDQELHLTDQFSNPEWNERR